MRCLQMPFFWFMSSANGIKRISCKKFCFNVRLESNPRTRHTTRIHGARCYSAELRGIRMSKFPPLLLRKRATTSSLSQNLFCQLQVKGEWLAILESLKKEKQTRPIATTINQTNKVLLRAKNDIYIYIYLWCPFGALASNFSEWLTPLIFSISISTYSGEALALGWPWSLSLPLPLLLCLHI